MVMKISPKWKMDSAAELAVKNEYVPKKSKNYPLTGSRYLGGVGFPPPERTTHYRRPSYLVGTQKCTLVEKREMAGGDLRFGLLGLRIRPMGFLATPGRFPGRTTDSDGN